MLPGTTYEFESGGDPLEIPNFTYEEFLDFHKKYYSPGNCLFYMCGNIPTEKQLDYFAENFIPRLENKYNLKTECKNYKEPLPHLYNDIKTLTKITPDYSRSETLKFLGPKSGPDGNFAGLCSYAGNPDIEMYFLMEVLSGSDSSPLSKKLKDSGLGDDVFCSALSEERQVFFSIGLIGVKKGNEEKVRKLILKSLKEIYKKGISQDEIDGAIMAIDFQLREEKRSGGPKALDLMNKVMESWNFGYHPTEYLFPLRDFERVKTEIKSNKNYFKSLMEKYFINKNGKIFVIVEPSEKYLEERNNKELQIIKNEEIKCDKDALKKQLDELHKYQETPDSEEALKCLKRLEISELPVSLPNMQPEIKTVEDITVVKSIQPTNGIVYFEVFFPCDSLKPDEFLDLPLFSDSLLDLGWKGKKWDQCILEANKIAGDISTNGLVGTVRKNPLAKKFEAEMKDRNFIGREWEFFTMKILDSKLEEGLPLLSDILTGIDFKDVKRMKTLIRECKAERKAAIIPGGLDSCIKRAKINSSKRESLIQEIIYGITQLKHGIEYKEEDAAALLKKFSSMYKTITESGCLIRIITDEKSMEHIDKMLPDFIKKNGLKPLEKRTKTPASELKNVIWQNDSSKIDIMPCDTQVGYAAASFKNSSSVTKEFAAESTLCEWMNTHPLWEKLRTVHGCYGASIDCDAADEALVISTYRDPSPSESFDIVNEALKETSEHVFTQEETECAIISMYSGFAMPRTPQNRGSVGCNRLMYAQTQKQVDKALELVTEIKPEDLNKAARRLYENSLDSTAEKSKAMMCSKNSEYSGNILDLPL